MGILQKPHSSFLEVFIYIRVVDHFAQQKDPLARVFINGAKSDLDGIFNTIAKSKMACQINVQITQVKQGGAEVFFHLMWLFTFLFCGTNKRGSVYSSKV